MWDCIANLWRQASRIYSDRLKTGNKKSGDASNCFDYLVLLDAADDILKKRLSLNFKLHHVDGQVHDCIQFSCLFFSLFLFA